MKAKNYIFKSVIFIGFLMLFLRIFYFDVSDLFNSLVTDILIISIIVLSFIFLILTIVKIKKQKSSFIVLLLFICLTIFFPFEFIFGFINFKFNKSFMNSYIKKLNNGEFDEKIFKLKYPEEGLMFKVNNKSLNILKTKSLKAMFFWQSHIRTYEEYCGILYISDENFLHNKQITNFLNRDFKAKKLEKNWFWIDCYIIRKEQM